MTIMNHIFAFAQLVAYVALIWRFITPETRLQGTMRAVGIFGLIFASICYFVTPEWGARNVFNLEGTLVSFVGLFLLAAFFAYKNAGDDAGGHIRGARVVDESVVAQMLRNVASRFKVGAVPVPRELETRGFLLAGSPGTGKSQALTAALDALHAAKSTAIIADASGIYYSRYADPGDADGYIIINPFDARSVAWSPLAEIESVADIPALAKSMIPDAEGSAQEWNNYAQTALEAILQYAFETGGTNATLFELAAVADTARLREVFAGTPAAPLVADGNERMWGSVRAIVASYLKAYQYLDPDVGADGFSIRKHIVEQRPGWIFLTYQQQHRDALKSLIGACVDIAARAVLSLPPSLDRRVVFALDEMPLLGKVQSIVDLATNGRKHGAVIFAGLQTIAQVRDCYGRETAQTLLSCLGSWLVLRVSDAETADYMSRYLGEEEKIRIVESASENRGEFGSGQSSKSKSQQQQYTQSRVVLPSELQGLPDLNGYFNLAGDTPTARVRLAVQRERKVAEAFVPAPPRRRAAAPQQQQQQSEGSESSDLTV